ncbi:MAG: arginyltransferase [Gammaproteobacteria bacterium]|jgi:arginine-tRNA-protein transferase|nr:arginyltransferase [Gammaproteobacteria bacterium]MBT3858820.1 arginyltransferase [Gammaproteobacteria bacterium]MBT3986171.1 arginyltransferase [Gammaproteobacteria bacterium]MBT4257049.1 arginyltransferase [Gammaproteobacteria bacterium]MBT4581337.1 arginyltransferase [Gammaproteobacteria bacterium]
MNSKSKLTKSIKLFRTAPHDCSYKSDELATTVFVDPELKIDQALNSSLSQMGFRRSGAHLYRPDCDSCQACISCRVPVDKFEPGRRYRKILKNNEDLKVLESEELDKTQAYPLYKDYINTRHKDGDMYPASPEQFDAFICNGTESTRFYSFYCGEDLLAVSVVDILEHGLSAVYTFFDPEQSRRSLGIYVILWQIQQAAKMHRPYLFLGYWIKDCPKMNYKSDFRPLELFIEGRWCLVN